MHLLTNHRKEPWKNQSAAPNPQVLKIQALKRGFWQLHSQSPENKFRGLSRWYCFFPEKVKKR